MIIRVISVIDLIVTRAVSARAELLVIFVFVTRLFHCCKLLSAVTAETHTFKWKLTHIL